MARAISWALLALAAPAQDAPSIDSILRSSWKEKGIEPAARCSDAEFLRRASLDLLGRIPSVPELVAFLARPDRAARVDEMLASEEFSRFWSELWATMLNGYTDAFETSREGLRLWLFRQFQARRPYDEIAGELLTASGETASGGPVNFIARHYANPAAKVSRTFLGVRIHCAQCHDHPFDRWTQEDYRDLTRFFAPLERRSPADGSAILADNVDKARGARPRFLNGARPVTAQWRGELSLHVRRSREFARAFANRIWYLLLGRGIVHPPDDFTEKNRPSVPGLLEFLADLAVRTRWDLRSMIRTICLSEPYQLSSVRPEAAPERERLFALRTLKPLTPEQIYDSTRLALDLKPTHDSRKEFIRRLAGQDPGEEFLNVWEVRETTQGLMMKMSWDPPAPGNSLEDLFRRILSRAPSPRERELCRGQDLKDVALALLNSNEFLFNH
jgi:hypothetical protein